MSCKASLAALRLYGYFCDIVVMMLLLENKYDDDDDAACSLSCSFVCIAWFPRENILSIE